jgi:hypothetical protein
VLRRPNNWFFRRVPRSWQQVPECWLRLSQQQRSLAVSAAVAVVVLTLCVTILSAAWAGKDKQHFAPQVRGEAAGGSGLGLLVFCCCTRGGRKSQVFCSCTKGVSHIAQLHQGTKVTACGWLRPQTGARQDSSSSTLAASSHTGWQGELCSGGKQESGRSCLAGGCAWCSSRNCSGAWQQFAVQIHNVRPLLCLADARYYFSQMQPGSSWGGSGQEPV